MADAPTRDSYARALAAEFVTALEAVLGAAAATPDADAIGGEGWLMTAAVTGDLRGSLAAWIDRAGSEMLAQRILGMDEAPDAATMADMLKEMWAQAAGALSLKDPFTGIKLSVSAVEPGAAPPGVAVKLSSGDATARIAIGGDVMAAPAPVKIEPAVRVPELVASDTLEAVLDMELPLVVRFARTVMSLKTLSGLGPGSIVDMERSPDEPVQMLIGDRVIARGEVVVVGGHYGVRVTDLVSPAERARALEV
jgi:flagellar motor switch protein FliN/FliY